MKDYFRKTLVIVTKAECGNAEFFDKKILGLTSPEWIEKRLAPYFKRVVRAEDIKYFDAEGCVFVDWDCTLADADRLSYGGCFVKVCAKTFAFIEKSLQSEILDELAAKGAVIHDRQNLVVDVTVKIARGAEIYSPNVIKGNSAISSDAVIFPYCFLADCKVGSGTEIKSTFAECCEIGQNCRIGPFAYLRPGSAIGDNCRVGDFVEIKNSVIADNVKTAHLSYIGDAKVGENTNVGCGVVFANYDGKEKCKTVVGKNCFLGSNVNLVAPVNLGDGVFVAAGTTVTDDVVDGAFVIGRSRQTIKEKK